MGILVIDQPFDIIFHARCGFIAGRDRSGDIAAARMQRSGKHSGQSARLAGDANRARALGRGDHVGFDEGQRHALDIIGAAKAVRAFDHHAIFGGDGAQFELFLHAFLTRFGEAGRVDHHGAAATLGQAAHGIEHEGTRNGENCAVDAFRQLIDRSVALEALNLFPLGVHGVDVAREFILDEIVEQRRAERAVPVGCTDNRNALGAQQPVDLLVGEALAAH